MRKGIRNRWLLNLGLLAAIALLLLLLPSEEKQPTTETTLAGFLPADIQTIRIMRAGKADILFEKPAGVWRMVVPYAVNADPALIRNLLSIRSLRVHLQTDSSTIQLADFALQEPAVSLTLNQTRIDFGTVQPVGNLRYLLLDDKLMLVDDNMQELLNTSSLSYIDRQLIPANASIKSIRIDGQAVDLNAAWAAARANWISLHAPDAAGKADSAEGTPVEIELKDTGTIMRFIAQKREADGVLIRDEPAIEYHISHDDMAELGLTAAASDAKPQE